MAMPSAATLSHDISALNEVDIRHVVCLQQEQESVELGLSDEEKTCTTHGIRFTRFAIEDFGVPEEKSLSTLVHQLYSAIHSGENTLVHCKGGIGRSGLICCCLLVKSGVPADAAIATVSKNRQHAVPETPAQFLIIRDFAKKLSVTA